MCDDAGVTPQTKTMYPTKQHRLVSFLVLVALIATVSPRTVIAQQRSSVSSGVGAQTQEPPIPSVHGKGTLYILGGASSFDRVEEFVAMVGLGKPIAVIVTADSDGDLREELVMAGIPEDTIPEIGTRGFEELVESNLSRYPTVVKLKKAGFSECIVMHTRNRKTADDPQFADRLDRVAAVYLVGGSQSRYSAAYEGTRTLRKMHELLERGGAVYGSSAGASVQGDYHLGGGRYKKGFRFLSHSVIGQHMDARDRELGSLVDVLHSGYDQFLGIGLSEDTAIEVKDHSFKVRGASYVFVHDRSQGMGRIDMLVAGATYDMATRTATPGDSSVLLAYRNTDRTHYGHLWDGVNINAKRGLVAHFMNEAKPKPIELSVRGYGVDEDDEVEVWVNGRSFGHLSEGSADGLSATPDTFRVPAHYLSEGLNTILFKQDIKEFNAWGVTDLLIRRLDKPVIKSISLEIGRKDLTKYGHRWPEGDMEIGNSLQAEFLNAKSSVDRTLSLIGYDIDKGREVAVFVNGRKLGAVSEGDDKEYSKTDSFRIPAAYQVIGRNVIVIRQDKQMQYPWGVKAILVE